MSDKHHDSSSSSSSSDSDDHRSFVSGKFSRLFGREKSMHKLLGGGRPDVLLWRNKKASLVTLSVATLIWVLFECLEYHFLTFVCHILILCIVTMFVWSNGATLLKKSPPRIPEIRFPEEVFLNIASLLRVEANRLSSTLHDVASGRNLKNLVVAVGSLWILSVIGSWCNFLTLLYIAFLVIQMVPVLYENHEDKLESWAHIAIVEIKKQYRAFDRKVLNKIPRGPVTKPKKLK